MTWLKNLFAAGVAALVLAMTSNPASAGEEAAPAGKTARFVLLGEQAKTELKPGTISLELSLCTAQAFSSAFQGDEDYTVPITYTTQMECPGGHYRSDLFRYGPRVGAVVGQKKAVFLELMPGEELLDWSQGLPWNHGNQPVTPVAAPAAPAPPPSAPTPAPQQTGQAPQKGPYPEVCRQDEESWMGETDRCRAALKAAGWTDGSGRVVSRQELIGRCVARVEDHNQKIDECLGGGGGYLANRGQDALDEKCRDLDNDVFSLGCGFTAAEMRAQGADRLMCGKRGYASECYDDPEYHASLGGNGLAGSLSGKF